MLAGIGCALVMLLVAGPILRVLPEPELGAGESKPTYASLAEWPFVTGCALLAGVTGGLGWALSPGPTRPLWLVLGTAGVLLAVVDAATTWLPLPLTRAAWLLSALAAAVVGVTGGVPTLLRVAAGAAIAGALYLGVWLVSRGGFGFGDVRFAPLIGAAAAAHSFTVLLWALLFGSLVGAVHGLLRLATRRRDPFPYAPSILAGAYLALVLNAAVQM